MVARVRNRFHRSFLSAALPALVSFLSATLSFGEEARVAKGRELLLVDTRAVVSSNAFSGTTLPSSVRIESRKGRMLVAAGGISSSLKAAKNECLEIMRANPGVICEPNIEFKVAKTPNDTFWSYQNNLRAISASRAWDFTVGSPEVLVAVIDTGVDYFHPDLAANIAVNSAEIPDNKLDDDQNGYVDDVFGYDFSDADSYPLDLHGHGTHVAGIIAARGDDNYGISGVSWKAGVLPVRVLDADGSGTLADVIAGVDYAVARGASVLNLSLGAPYGSKLFLQALQRAELAGAVIVVAAGNESNNNDDTPSFPASYQLPSLISVAATDSNDELAYFSNTGAATVHLAAPGVSILSTLPLEGYAFMSGTSMAAPHVAGVAALVKSINPSLSGVAIKDIILGSADILEGLKGSVSSGGRLSASGAVVLAEFGLVPGNSGGSVKERLAIDLRQRALRGGRHVEFSASVYSLATGLPEVGAPVVLVCGKRTWGATSTDAEGAARFSKIAKSKKSVNCYAEVRGEGTLATSNPLRLRSLQR
jgi:subtilisin family serine protease